jgi:hypothetical protein
MTYPHYTAEFVVRCDMYSLISCHVCYAIVTGYVFMTSTSEGQSSASLHKKTILHQALRQIAQPHRFDPAVVCSFEVTAGTRTFFVRLSVLRCWSCGEIPSPVVWGTCITVG